MEQVRRAVRSLLPYNSSLYRSASRIYNFLCAAIKESPRVAIALVRADHKSSGQPEWLHFKRLEHPICVRPGTPDVAAIWATVIREDHGHFVPSSPVLSVIDAGAYIGDSAAYFLSRHPGATLVALEPDPGNFAVAEVNLRPYGERVRLIPAALSNEAGRVRFAGNYDGGYISDAGIEVRATTIPDLLRLTGWATVGILKIDIEGAEQFVLDESADEWLPLVDLLIVEIHGCEIEKKVRRIIERSGFEMRLHRTSWYCVRKNAK